MFLQILFSIGVIMAGFEDDWERLKKKPIGKGGQGIVYKVARKTDINKNPYVAKVFKNIDPTDSNRLERFRREAETTKGLSHTNIIEVFEAHIDISEPYLIMEYCSGGSLAEPQNPENPENVGDSKNPFWQDSPVKTLELFKQICEGVAEAHNNNIVHRDLKPDNILLRTPTGPAVVSDFGICYLVNGNRLTRATERVGARFYMAPEQYRGKEVEVKKPCDIYALGKILYWLFSGADLYREEYRQPDYDLRSMYDEKIEYINVFLDKMIREKANERIDIQGVLDEIPKVIRLFEGNYNIVEKGIKQKCLYCGVGTYQKVPGEQQDIRTTFGFNNAQPDLDWRALICDNCGNVQIFRLENCNHKDWLD